MKALRYLLIVMMLSVAGLVFATAQGLAQQPKAEMHSTSGMISSGSALPSAATSGAVVTGSKLGTYETASTASEGPSGRRKAKKDENPFGEDIGGTDNPLEPGSPIGDAGWPLMLLALAYAIYRVRRRIRA